MSGSREKGIRCRNRRWHLKPKPIDLIARCIWICVFGAVSVVNISYAQEPLTWEQVKAKFEAANPALRADQLNVDEMKAEEITAFLRPNPQFTAATDGTQLAPHNG